MKKNLNAALGRSLTRQEFLKLGGAGLAGTALLGTAGCGLRGSAGGGGGNGGGENYEIRFSHIHPAGTSKALAAEKFKEVVEEKSEGQITVEIFPNGQLYADEEGLQALQGGSVEMLAPAAGIFTGVASKMGLFDLPYLVEPGESMAAAIQPDSVIGETVYENENLEANNIKVLGVWDYGFVHFWSNKAIREPNDIEGQKLRIVQGEVLRDRMVAWGANPVPMALGEVYTAIQQGVIDGYENGFTSTEAIGAYEVLDYVTLTNHAYNSFLLVTNIEFFDSLPQDLQQTVTEAADEATAYNQEIALEQDQEAKSIIQEAGTTEFIQLSEEQHQAIKDEVVPSVYEKNVDMLGQELVDELLA